MDKFEEILQPIAELLAKKEHDYGSSYGLLRTKYGSDSFLIRLADKFNRLEVLTKHESQIKAESIEDTIQDIIGYCTLELRYRRDKANATISTD